MIDGKRVIVNYVVDDPKVTYYLTYIQLFNFIYKYTYIYNAPPVCFCYTLLVISCAINYLQLNLRVTPALSFAG